MKRKLLQNFSVNAVQLIINQLLGLGIFYIMSTGLDKNTFGLINLALAILMAVFNILSCGIDQLVIKKIAAGADIQSTVSLYAAHVLFTGIVFYGLFFSGYLLFANTNHVYALILFIGIGKLMIFFSTPFKQAANGMEHFRLLAYMSVISNIVRCFGMIFLVLLFHLNLQNIILLFIAGDTAELFFCVFLFNFYTKIPLTIRWNKTHYLQLLREALPQTGVALITSALARFDWIFIGILVSAAKLAEYSFAYKIFEISTLPLLAIAPLLIPKFTKLFKQTAVPVDSLMLFIRIEMIIAAFTVLILNICWVPVIDGITSGKYGYINVKTIFILSLCLPILYLNNFFWTTYFAQGRLKMILTSFIIAFIVNVAGDVALIPFLKNEGAAFAFLLACVVQTTYYLRQNRIKGLQKVWHPLALSVLCALLSGFMAKMVFENDWFKLISAVLFYVALLFVTAS